MKMFGGVQLRGEFLRQVPQTAGLHMMMMMSMMMVMSVCWKGSLLWCCCRCEGCVVLSCLDAAGRLVLSWAIVGDHLSGAPTWRALIGSDSIHGVSRVYLVVHDISTTDISRER